MRTYFTYVMPYFAGAWHPIDPHLRRNFGNLKFTFNTYVAKCNDGTDGRYLGYIEVEGKNKTERSKITKAILGTFYNQVESVENAKDKIERWTGRTDLTIDKDKVVIPEIEKVPIETSEES